MDILSCKKRCRRRPYLAIKGTVALAIFCNVALWSDHIPVVWGLLDYSSYLPTHGDNEDGIDGTPASSSTSSSSSIEAESLFGGTDTDVWSGRNRNDAQQRVATTKEEEGIPKVVLPRARIKLGSALKEEPKDVPSTRPSKIPRPSLNQYKVPNIATAPLLKTSGEGQDVTLQQHLVSSIDNDIVQQQQLNGKRRKSDSLLLPNKETQDQHQSIEHKKESLRDEQRFLEWCQSDLGIFTILEIQTLDYELHQPTTIDWEDDMEAIASSTESDDTPRSVSTTRIRGLVAARDILEGQTVIRIPVRALYSVENTINQDPVLSKVLHQHTNWIEEELELYEIPLLAVALLHHRKLGSMSPIAPYIQVLIGTPVDMPFLWSADQLRNNIHFSEGVRMVARGIRHEIRTMYESVVQVLIEEHSELFGPDLARNEDGEWMFSFPMFQWAFAIVNTRHWQLPINDLTPTPPISGPWHNASVEDQVPPASIPTETWMQERGDVDDDYFFETMGQQNNGKEQNTSKMSGLAHSFLAPVADFLNFGPPCTRVRYDSEQQIFEVIATCSFHKGEEVTFWYSNECDDVMMGVYGFAHPLIRPCRTAEEWRQHTSDLERELKNAYDEQELLEEQLEKMEALFVECKCDDNDQPKLRQEQRKRRNSRRSLKGNGRREQQRIRRTDTNNPEF